MRIGPSGADRSDGAPYEDREDTVTIFTTTLRLGLATAATAIALGTSAAQADTITLRVSSGFPAVHDTVTHLMLPWLEELGRRSGVEIEPTVFAAGTSFGGLDRQLDQVERGLVDAAMGLAVVPRGRMPRTGLVDIPFLGSDTRQINAGISALLDTDLAPDYAGMKLVNVFADCAVLHTTNREINTLEDIRGLRIRVPSALGAATIAAVGGIPVAMPQSEIYESLQRNVIDGAVTPWDVIETLNLGEVMHYHTDNVLFCGQLWFGFNQRSFDRLPEPVQAAFEEIRGEYAVDLAQDVYARAAASAQDFARAQGGVFTRLSDADMAEWRALVAPAIDAHLDEVSQTVPDARTIYADLIAAIAAAGGAD